MKFGMLAAGTGLAMMMSVAAADAAPTGAASFQPATATSGAAQVLFVRGGCGWGAHLTYSGRCRLNYGWRGRVRARWGWRGYY